jgi:AcrR family transcriptional regulator
MTAAQRHSQLIATASAIFATTGFAATKMRDVADAADVDVAILYRHFASKEALFEACVVDQLRAVTAELIEEGRLLRDAPQEPRFGHLERGLIILVKAMESLGPQIGAALYSDNGFGPAFYRTHIVPLLDALTEAVTVDLEWSSMTSDWHLSVVGVFHLTLGIVTDARVRGVPLDAEEAGRSIAALISAAVRPTE